MELGLPKITPFTMLKLFIPQLLTNSDQELKGKWN
jgi:hypothetical protein